jgi:hypothetical protein
MTKINKSIWLVLGWRIVGIMLVQCWLGKGTVLGGIEGSGGGSKSGVSTHVSFKKGWSKIGGFFDLVNGRRAGDRIVRNKQISVCPQSAN